MPRAIRKRGLGEPENRGIRHDLHELEHVTELNVAGSRWSIAIYPNAQFAVMRRTWWPWVVLASGLIFTGILAAYLRLNIDRSRNTECLAETRARRLDERNVAMFAIRTHIERLEVSERRLRRITTAVEQNPAPQW